jgi:sec-independent protein translocase protein TatB
MFGIGLPELLLILALALIVLGPDRLPQLARQIARYMGKLKRASEELKSQLDIESLEKDIKHSKLPSSDSEEKSGTSNSKGSA